MNDWIIEDYTLSKKINNYTIKITILKNSINAFFRFEVYEKNRSRLTFNFNSLKDSINFAENTVSKCISIDEIIESYEKQIEENKFKPLVKCKY